MIWSGFVLGFLGSLHCVGMCGPIAVAAFGKSGRRQILPRLSYNMGRTVTYVLMGLSMGLIGQVVKLSGYQQIVSIITGAVILLLTIGYFSGITYRFTGLSQLLARIKRGLGKLMTKQESGDRFVMGIVNGFLPCGLVYMALAGALVTESLTDSILFMLFFGLGTIPAMFSISYVAPALSGVFNINRLIPYMFALVGIILILRGLSLGIPFISPDLNAGHSHMEHM